MLIESEELKAWLAEEDKEINFFRKKERSNQYFAALEYFSKKVKDKITKLEQKQNDSIESVIDMISGCELVDGELYKQKIINKLISISGEKHERD